MDDSLAATFSDVTPIEQDDGPTPVVRIAYSHAFSVVMAPLRAQVDMSDAAIEESLQQVRSDTDPTNWCLICYEGKNKLVLKVRCVCKGKSKHCANQSHRLPAGRGAEWGSLRGYQHVTFPASYGTDRRRRVRRESLPPASRLRECFASGFTME